MYLYECAIVSYLLLLVKVVIGIGLPLFRNFGRPFVCMRARVHVCMRAQARAQARGYVCVFNRSSLGFCFLIDFMRARGCVRVRVCACV